MIFYFTFVYIIILNLQNNRSLNILVLNIFLLSCLCYYFFTYSFIKRGEKKDRNNMVVSIRNTQIRSQNDEISLLPCKKIQNIFFSDTFHLSPSTSHVQQESYCIIFCSLSRTPDMSNEIFL